MSTSRSLKPGRAFEDEVLGPWSRPPEPPARRKPRGRRQKGGLFRSDNTSRLPVGYLSYEKALIDAMSHGQLLGTKKEWPKAPIAKQMFWYVIRCLPREDQEKLQLYRTIGTPLDFFHRTDALFSLEGAVARIDLSLCPERKTDPEVIVISPETIADPRELARAMERVAKILKPRLRIVRRQRK